MIILTPAEIESLVARGVISRPQRPANPDAVEKIRTVFEAVQKGWARREKPEPNHAKRAISKRKYMRLYRNGVRLREISK